MQITFTGFDTKQQKFLLETLYACAEEKDTTERIDVGFGDADFFEPTVSAVVSRDTSMKDDSLLAAQMVMVARNITDKPSYLRVFMENGASLNLPETQVRAANWYGDGLTTLNDLWSVQGEEEEEMEEDEEGLTPVLYAPLKAYRMFFE